MTGLRHLPCGQLHWVALVAGVSVPAAGVAVSLTPLQGPGPEAIDIDDRVGPAPAAQEALPGTITPTVQSDSPLTSVGPDAAAGTGDGLPSAGTATLNDFVITPAAA